MTTNKPTLELRYRHNLFGKLTQEKINNYRENYYSRHPSYNSNLLLLQELYKCRGEASNEKYTRDLEKLKRNTELIDIFKTNETLEKIISLESYLHLIPEYLNWNGGKNLKELEDSFYLFNNCIDKKYKLTFIV